MNQRKLHILFLCTGNSCRSQMAEGWVRQLKGDIINPYSAGTLAKGLDPRAVQAMAEAGVDISAQRSKTVEDVLSVPFDWIITVCGHAAETCPVFPGRIRRFHAGFDDPPVLAREAATGEDAMDCYRRVRDEIRRFAESLPDCLIEV